MTARSRTEPCFACGAVVPVKEDGPTHDYMLSSPGCWAVYGEVLAREYGNAAYMANHRLTVDAYAVQHPGEPTPAARRSVLIHLVALCAVFEHGLGQRDATRLLQALGERQIDPGWLEPPEERGGVTVADVHAAGDPKAHLDAVERWARSAWRAWSPHHGPARRWVERML